MKKLNLLLAVALLVLSEPAANAQVTIDVTKITCDQFLLFKVVNPSDIALWLSGYYNSKHDNTIIDVKKFKKIFDSLSDYCRMNYKMTVWEQRKSRFSSFCGAKPHFHMR